MVESEWPELFHEEPLARLMSCPSGALIYRAKITSDFSASTVLTMKVPQTPPLNGWAGFSFSANDAPLGTPPGRPHRSKAHTARRLQKKLELSRV